MSNTGVELRHTNAFYIEVNIRIEFRRHIGSTYFLQFEIVSISLELNIAS